MPNRKNVKKDTALEDIRKGMLAAAIANIPYYFFMLDGTEAVLRPTTMTTEQIRNMAISDVRRMAIY